MALFDLNLKCQSTVIELDILKENNVIKVGLFFRQADKHEWDFKWLVRPTSQHGRESVGFVFKNLRSGNRRSSGIKFRFIWRLSKNFLGVVWLLLGSLSSVVFDGLYDSCGRYWRSALRLGNFHTDLSCFDCRPMSYLLNFSLTYALNRQTRRPFTNFSDRILRILTTRWQKEAGGPSDSWHDGALVSIESESHEL